ncbi:cobalt ECF transporter T component CbiQ [Thermohalobacter berrensis]|uniref:Cobalt ECF transporter T component CbiQ n=1 Tax=Thermohalobacter berrensis TaxID=99594 RepID=A0A419SZK9_9FIRM|nr:cobalt ECF transporter T component CbiQ [Thermohalobacter berrensis]RKD30618.1 cobalt ECF transporter T component CbiQ [Thermohalobacter berrensis]
MLIIDKYAYINKLKEVNPFTKVIFYIVALAVALFSNNLYIWTGIVIAMSILIVVIARIPLTIYLKILTVPLLFLVFGSFAVLFSIDIDKNNFIFSLKVINFYIGITEISLNNTFMLFMRSISTITSTFFLILTTPINDLIYVLKLIRLPDIFIEIIVLTYRFIFIFLKECKEIYTAQQLRFGYVEFKNSLNSISSLVACLFIRVMKRYEEMKIALEVKGYNGKFHM